jgi:hypothetical protein
MRAVPGLPLIVCAVAAVAGLGAGCSDPDPYPPGFGGPGQPLAPGDGAFCQSDADCFSGQQCARINYCFATSELRAVHVAWTIDGMPAGSDTCTPHPDLELSFLSGQFGPGSDVTFAPVPCVEGKFTIDKLPLSYNLIGLGDQDLGFVSASVDDTTGDATVDLKFH